MNLVSIENGWVFAKYKIDNREYCLQGSNMFDYDVIEEQPDCWTDNGARSFDEKDFVRYLNEEVLFECNERAYIMSDNIAETKNITVLKF